MPALKRTQKASRKNFDAGGGCQQGANGRFVSRKKPCLAALRKVCHFCTAHTPEADRRAGGYYIEKCCAYKVLSQEPDFLEQKPWLQEAVEKHTDFYIIFYPKYHCELNFIEMVWALIKNHHRRTCTYNFKDLISEAKGLPHTFATISVLSVKRMFNHCLRYMSGYRSDLTGFQLEYAVKKYKGHRAVPSSHNKLTANELAKWLIKPSMVLKKLQ
jgi:hypothetical protein